MGVGSSGQSEERVAAEQAVAMARVRLKAPESFALVFCTDGYRPEVFAREMDRALGGTPWAGCVTAGVFANEHFLRRGVAVGLVGEGASFGVGSAGPMSADSRAAGRRATASALGRMPPLSRTRSRSVILLPDGVAGDINEALRGAAEEAGAGVRWGGGGSGDNFNATRTAQFANGRAHADRVVAIAIDVERAVGIGLEHGWAPLGPVTLVTRATGDTVEELDYGNAFDVYRHTAACLGLKVTRENFTEFAMLHPFGSPLISGGHLITDLVDVDAEGGIRSVSEIAEGSLVRMMVSTPESLLQAGIHAGLSAREAVGGDPGAALVFDCVSRAQIFGDKVETELLGIGAALGKGVPLLGLLSMGEISAMGGGVPQLQNKTALVMAF